MRESVFVGMQRNEPRPRMTVAHELSHYLLKHVGLLNRSTLKTVREISVPLVRHQESEARRLAPIILAPEYLIPTGATPAEIAGMFNFTLRKADVDALRRSRVGEKRPLPKSVIDYLAKAQRRGYTTRSR